MSPAFPFAAAADFYVMLGFLTSRLGLEILAVLALLTAGTIAWQVHDRRERSIGAQHELAAVVAASDKAKADAQRQIDSLNTQHAAAVAAIEAQRESDLKDAAAQHDSDTQRLRDYEASRRRVDAALAGTGPAAAPADAGPEGVSRLGSVALELADALRADDAALTECWRERDSLTGK